jgi:cytochrome b561
MPMDHFLNQSSAGEAAPAPLRYGALIPMAPSNARRPSYDGLTISVHWATVFLVLMLFVSAWEARHSDFAPVLLQIHRSFGVTIWVVTALRIGWRLTRASLPPFPTQMTKLQRAAVKLNEYGLYALLLGQPATGLLTTFFGGRSFTLFLWQIPALMSRDEMLRAVFHLSHEIGAWALAALTVGHAAAALFHHFVLRDDVLECMAPVMQRHVPSRNSKLAPSFRHGPDTSRICISQSST